MKNHFLIEKKTETIGTVIWDMDEMKEGGISVKNHG